MFLAGAKNLEAKKEWINELNVFPVPDGDTGTNMTMTIMSAAKEVSALPENPDMEVMAKAISSGSLRGARGNSGVILSQLLRGFTKVMKEHDELDIELLVDACDKAVESAYKAVMKPKEGTILTVAKGICDKSHELHDNGCEDMQVFIEELIKEGDIVLAKTPDLLPVLKQAGVVDSGGQGLMQVLKGAYDAFMGKEIDYSIDSSSATPGSAKPSVEVTDVMSDEDIKFGYCTEFIIMLNKTFNIKHEMDFKSFLESIGDSIVLVADDEIVKVHVHTNDPGLAIQRALKYGALSNMKIDNMRLEHQEKLFKASEKAAAGVNDGTGLAEDVDVTIEACGDAKQGNKEEKASDEPRKEVGFIAVSVGEGLDEVFNSLGVDMIISGGQTMNPSTEDFVNAAAKVNADTLFVFPNNKNIVMAANQAQYLVEDKKLVVIPTKTVPQGITAMINYVPDMSVEENEAHMNEEIGNVKTGEVTYAVRDTTIDDKDIKQGDYMGIGDAGILANGTDMDEVVMSMIEQMVDDDAELISIYYGEDVDEAKATELSDLVADKYSDLDVELQPGGQPIYYYIVSVE
ncbi:MAG: DAK2 domain-containing protein [Lachnospiraceae bacterium]|nr:DAK2 domain-containing protein [Lachnospiraceae bacterium]